MLEGTKNQALREKIGLFAQAHEEAQPLSFLAAGPFANEEIGVPARLVLSELRFQSDRARFVLLRGC